jgi:hypothetical protein
MPANLGFDRWPRRSVDGTPTCAHHPGDTGRQHAAWWVRDTAAVVVRATMPSKAFPESSDEFDSSVSDSSERAAGVGETWAVLAGALCCAAPYFSVTQRIKKFSTCNGSELRNATVRRACNCTESHRLVAFDISYLMVLVSVFLLRGRRMQ